MDPLSVTAGIIAVLQISGKVINICYDYQKGTRNASRDINKIVEEVTDLRNILENLKKLVDSECKDASQGPASLNHLTQPDGALVKCVAALTALESKLNPQHGLRAVKQALVWPLKEAEVNKTVDQISRFKETLSIALNVDQRHAIRAVHNDVTALKGSYSSDRLDEHRRKVHKWLAAPDPSVNHDTARKKHQQSPTTGVWLLKSSQFEDWMTQPYSFLWLYGIPGCGKTILCSTVIQEFVPQCQSDPTLAMAYFYFDFNDTEKQSCNNLIRSLIEQLSSNCQKIPDVLQKSYSRCQDGQKQPTNDDLLEILLDILKAFRHTYVIIDALDECKEREEKLLPFIEDMIDWKLANVHILVTSRKEKDIEDALRPLVTDQLSLEKLLDEDIRIHIRERLQHDKKLKEWPAQVQAEIENALTNGAHGMFRWVFCQLEAIRKCRTIHALRKALETLPKTLDDTYARILSNIEDEDSENALKILQWLCFSTRPVRLLEMVEVLATDLEGSPYLDRDRRLLDPRDILRICPSLVTIVVRPLRYNQYSHSYVDEDDVEFREGEIEELRLAHFSVKEYLVSGRIAAGSISYYRISKRPANVAIAETCVAYLLHFDGFDVSSCTLQECPLSVYAAKQWVHHYRTIGDDASRSRLDDLCVKLLRNEGKCVVNWLRLFDPEYKWEKPRLAGKMIEDVASPLCYASMLGLIGLANQLLQMGADVNAQGGRYGNALQAASSSGHEQVVKLLLDKGANVNAQSGQYGNALQAASASATAKEQIVELLLDKEADVNAQGGPYGNALQAASSGGHEQVVKLLLDKGADVNAQGEQHGDALQAALWHRNEQIAKLLLDRGAEVTSYVLRAAASSGQNEAVKLLLEKNPDVDKRDALNAAAERGHEILVEFLFDSGADVTSDALAAAAYYGHEEICKLLLEKDIDIDKSDALNAAALQNKEEMVKLLLDKGANINAQGTDKNALCNASYAGNEDIIKLLLEMGADVHIRGPYRKAFHQVHWERKHLAKLLLDKGAHVGLGVLEAAVYGAIVLPWEYPFSQAQRVRHENIVTLLLEKGAVVTRAAIRAAAAEGWEEIVKLLLDKDPGVETDGALYAAVATSKAHEGVVRLLLENGTVVTSDVLREAASYGQEGIVKLLLDKDPSIGTDDALQVAATGGHEVVVRLLLENGAAVTSDALRVAASAGWEEIVKLLLDKDPGVDTGDALYEAAVGGHGVVVKLLLENGAVATCRVLWRAASLEVSKMLIIDRVTYSRQGEELGNELQKSLYWDHRSCVSRLLSMGVNVDSSFLKGASSFSHETMVKRSLDREGGGDSEFEDTISSLAFEEFDKLHLQRDATIERHPRFASWALENVVEVVKLLPNKDAAATLTYRQSSSCSCCRRWSVG